MREAAVCRERQSLSVLPHYLARFLYLLILPTLRGLGYALFSDLEAWFRAAWLDLLILALIAGLAVLRWRMTGYSLGREGLTLCSGVLIRQISFFPTQRITGAESRQSWWLRLFRAEALTLRCTGAETRLYVSRRRARTLCELLGVSPRGTGRLYRPDTAHLGLFALLTSDSLGGVVFAGVLVSRLGSLFGREVQEAFVGALTDVVRLAMYGVPDATLTAALWLLAAWGVSFARTLVEHAHTRLRRAEGDPARLTVEFGVLCRIRVTVRTEALEYLELRQTLPGLACGLSTAYIGAPGLKKDDLRVLLLSAKEAQVRATAIRLCPECTPTPVTIRSGRRLRYIRWPLIGLLLLTAAFFLSGWAAPFWEPLIRFVCGMLCLPAGWLLAAGWLGSKKAGIGWENGRVTVIEPRRGAIREATFPAEAVREVTTRRTLLGKTRCTLAMRVGRERGMTCRIRGLRREDAAYIADCILQGGARNAGG